MKTICKHNCLSDLCGICNPVVRIDAADLPRLVRLRWAWALLSNNAPIDDAILLEADKAENFTALQDAFGEVDPFGAPEPIQPLMLVDAWCSLTLPYEL